MAIRFTKIGIIGTGKVALDHAETIEALGATIVAGCASSSQSESWRTFSGRYPGTNYASLKTILSDPEIDAVVSCIHVNQTNSILELLLSSKKPILLEKPIAMDLSLMDNLVVKIDPGLLVNKVAGYNRRHYATVKALAKRISSGGLLGGRILISENPAIVESKIGRRGLEQTLIYGSTSHILDAALYIFGPLDVQQLFSSESRTHAPYKNVRAWLTTANGTPIELVIQENAPFVVGIECNFDDASIVRLGPMEKLTTYKGYHIDRASNDRRVNSYSPAVVETLDTPSDLRPGFLEQMSAFLQGNFSLSATSVDCIRLHRLVEQLQRGHARISRSQEDRLGILDHD